MAEKFRLTGVAGKRGAFQLHLARADANEHFHDFFSILEAERDNRRPSRSRVGQIIVR